MLGCVSTLCSSGSQLPCATLAASPSLGSLLITDLINQTLQEWGPEICVFNKPPSNSDWPHLLSHHAGAPCTVSQLGCQQRLWLVAPLPLSSPCPSRCPFFQSPSPSWTKPRIPHLGVRNKACGEGGRGWSGTPQNREDPNPDSYWC